MGFSEDKWITLTTSMLKAWFAIFLCKAHCSPRKPTTPCPNNCLVCGSNSTLSTALFMKSPLIISGSEIANRGFDPNHHKKVFP